ncbi:MAG: hypothetical protein HMLKMBBP_03294 [Planctomycetes bacterium]|nr:hypothetical protein [Planctomycetota bacterium]
MEGRIAWPGRSEVATASSRPRSDAPGRTAASRHGAAATLERHRCVGVAPPVQRMLGLADSLAVERDAPSLRSQS